MAINWKRPGWTWVKNTAEIAAVVFVADVTGAMLDAPKPDLRCVDWLHGLSHGGYDALIVIGYGILGLHVPNGTWSRIRNVIALPKPPSLGVNFMRPWKIRVK